MLEGELDSTVGEPLRADAEFERAALVRVRSRGSERELIDKCGDHRSGDDRACDEKPRLFTEPHDTLPNTEYFQSVVRIRLESILECPDRAWCYTYHAPQIRAHCSNAGWS